jgi:hypothetical protein
VQSLHYYLIDHPPLWLRFSATACRRHIRVVIEHHACVHHLGRRAEGGGEAAFCPFRRDTPPLHIVSDGVYARFVFMCVGVSGVLFIDRTIDIHFVSTRTRGKKSCLNPAGIALLCNPTCNPLTSCVQNTLARTIALRLGQKKTRGTIRRSLRPTRLSIPNLVT